MIVATPEAPLDFGNLQSKRTKEAAGAIAEWQKAAFANIQKLVAVSLGETVFLIL